MPLPISPEECKKLEQLVTMCREDPEMLHKPELAFMREFIEHFGGKVPKAKVDKCPCKEEAKPDVAKEPEPEPEPESEESDLELDMSAVIEPDTDAPQKMGNLTLQPTEEEIAESQSKRSEAVSAFVEKDYEKAIELYTEAIVLNPQASLLYAKRGQIFLLMNKPNACIRDCDRALELNPDSAAAHKFRGRAYYLLGKFEEAASDLRLACKFDFDEQADEWLREVTPNVSTVSSETKKIQLKRKFISLEEKIQILDRLQDGERVSSVAKSYNLNEATVRTIKNSEQKIRKNVAEGCPLRAKRVARTRDIDVVRMEHALIIWMEDCLEKRIPLNGNTIRQKALQIYKHLKENGQSSTNRQIHSFCASKGWLERLKARFSLRNNELLRKRTSEDEMTAITIKVEPPEIIETGEYTAD